jgi:hypothetical protein
MTQLRWMVQRSWPRVQTRGIAYIQPRRLLPLDQGQGRLAGIGQSPAGEITGRLGTSPGLSFLIPISGLAIAPQGAAALAGFFHALPWRLHDFDARRYRNCQTSIASGLSCLWPAMGSDFESPAAIDRPAKTRFRHAISSLE